MCEAASTWRARMWLMPPALRIAAYSGLIAAPGTPKAVFTPSFSMTCTAASMAFIFDILVLRVMMETPAQGPRPCSLCRSTLMAIDQRPNAVDDYFHRRSVLDRSNAQRRSAGDHVSRQQRQIVRDSTHEFSRGKDHV